MTIHFRGGEIRQKGKGIGGFFRGLVNLFRPMVRTAGSSIAKARESGYIPGLAPSAAASTSSSIPGLAYFLSYGLIILCNPP